MAERDVPNGAIKRLPMLGGRLCIFWEASLGSEYLFPNLQSSGEIGEYLNPPDKSPRSKAISPLTYCGNQI